MPDKPINILLVDDHLIVRNGVRMMLTNAADMHIVAEASDAREAMQLADSHQIDVALVDIALPGTNGLDLLRQLKARQPDLAVLILSMYAEDIYAVRAIKLGAAGYLTKDNTQPILVDAIRCAAQGGKYITPALASQLAFVLSEGRHASYEALSNRELEVLKLIAKGESLVNVGSKLHLSPSTITTYRSRILKKLGLKNNIDLSQYAQQHGLLN